ncbi:MAG TPA: thiamine pyrophosphate-dependent enzyme [Bacteroidales bacterium]|nr:thiamine pyrophosphate-dependent enzyme [Bacteroidales bacterium]HSA43860.1 thiamine pyrophosphate-dependent enzyme [Bacteroidales bacterium]
MLETEEKVDIYSIDKKTLERWYALMSLGRLLDDRAPNYLKQALGWSYHAPYAGHDGIQLAIGQVFDREKDHLFPYYRDMLTVISAGLSAEEIILNGISKATDVAGGGRHMSNHFAKPEWNIHNVSSATGNHTLHAAGVARAMKVYSSGGVAISSQGESSTSEGYVYEAINGASNEKLPVIFVFQDNGYGISVSKKDQTANRYAGDNFTGFKNLRIIHCDGKNVFDSVRAMQEAKKHVLEKQEPVIVHASCVRIHSHSNSDRHELYRTEEELACTKAADPYLKFRKQLIHSKRFTDEELLAIEGEQKKIVSQAHKAALSAPDPNPDSIHHYLIPPAYEPAEDEMIRDAGGKKLKLIQALNETLKDEFRRNPHTYLWGQDVASKDKGGVFNVTKGMQQEFGKTRVFNAPIAEDYIVGTANGFSRFDPKIRIVVEGAEFADYFWPAMEQFVEMTHDYWRSNGQFASNVVIRLASGGYIGGGLYHSQTIEGVLSTFPGVRIVYPSSADDAAGLLRTAIRSQGPTVFLEPKALYNDPVAEAHVPDNYALPFGKARIRREGNDLTIITYGNTTHMCMKVADKIAADFNKSVEVVDLRSLIPLDKETVLASVKKTSRVLIVHEDKVFAGFGGELAAMITEEAFAFLDAPVSRVGATFTPVGFNRILEKAVLPDDERIFQQAIKLLEY